MNPALFIIGTIAMTLTSSALAQNSQPLTPSEAVRRVVACSDIPDKEFVSARLIERLRTHPEERGALQIPNAISIIPVRNDCAQPRMIPYVSIPLATTPAASVTFTFEERDRQNRLLGRYRANILVVDMGLENGRRRMLISWRYLDPPPQ